MVSTLPRTRRRNPARSPVAATRDITGNAATEKAMPMRLTGTLWKLRAKLTELTLPAAIPDATEVKNRNVMASMGCAMARGNARRTYSRNSAVRSASAGRYRKSVRWTPTTRMPRWSSEPTSVPMATPSMPMRRTQQQRAQHDAQVVQQGSEAVGQEPLAGDEQLAQRERDREHERGEAHLAEQARVQLALLGVEAGRHPAPRSRVR